MEGEARQLRILSYRRATKQSTGGLSARLQSERAFRPPALPCQVGKMRTAVSCTKSLTNQGIFGTFCDLSAWRCVCAVTWWV